MRVKRMVAHLEANVDMSLVMADKVLDGVDERGHFGIGSAKVKECQKRTCAIGKGSKYGSGP